MNTPPDVLAELAGSAGSLRVLRALCANPSTPVEAARVAASRAVAATNPDVPDTYPGFDEARTLLQVGRGPQKVGVAILGRTQEVFAPIMAHHPYWPVRVLAALSPHTPTDVLWELVGDGEVLVARVAADAVGADR